jgi:hypothetical protein
MVDHPPGHLTKCINELDIISSVRQPQNSGISEQPQDAKFTYAKKEKECPYAENLFPFSYLNLYVFVHIVNSLENVAIKFYVYLLYKLIIKKIAEKLCNINFFYFFFVRHNIWAQ